MSLLSIIRAAIAAMKSTSSTLVEYDNPSQSLPAYHDAQVNWNNEHGTTYCADVAALQALRGTDTHLAELKGVGMFYYNPTGNGGGSGANITYDSDDGVGSWDYYYTDFERTYKVTSTPTNGDTLMWNTGLNKGVWGTPTVSALDWGNITNKPIITGTTNPAVTNNLSVGGTLSVTGASTLHGITNTGNATVSGTLGVSGSATTAGITNTGEISSGTVSTTGDANVGGALSAVGFMNANGGLTVDFGLAGDQTLLFNIRSYASRSAAAAALNIGGVAGVNGGHIYRNSTIGCLDIT